MEDIREVLKQELRRLDAERAKIAKALSALNRLGFATKRGGSRSGRMSLAARKRIAAAQKARWKKWKASNKKIPGLI